MRSSLVIASLGAALTALASAIAPVKAEPISNAYPYCVFGRGGGSTTCYFRTREECGGGCVNNPAYVGPERASAILAAGGIVSDRSRALAKANARTAPRATPKPAPSVGVTQRPFNAGAHASVRGGADSFQGWPTDYLINRFGDHQAQGRF